MNKIDLMQTNIALSLLFLRRGDNTKAESMQRLLVELCPQDPAMHTNLALALFKQQKFKESIKYYKNAVELDPARGARYANLGKVYLAIGDLENAEKNFKEAIKLEPRNIDFLFLLAKVKKEAKKYSASKKVFERILEIKPFDEEAQEEVRSLGVMGY
jgi:tetratricopeptide (TPR) repeat protein